jgi:hypothetical protein
MMMMMMIMMMMMMVVHRCCCCDDVLVDEMDLVSDQGMETWIIMMMMMHQREIENETLM